MKKLVYLFLVFFLISCGSGADRTADISSDTSKTMATSGSSKISIDSILSQVERGNYRKGELLVKFKAGVIGTSSIRTHQAVGARVLKKAEFIPNLDLVKLPEKLSETQAIIQYMADPNVEYAEPNYFVSMNAVIPNDTFFGNQWALNNTGQAFGTPDADIDAAEAWEVSVGCPDIIVAVLDTGIDYNHADLVWNIWRNLGETDCNDEKDNDLNGFIDDCKGWDFTTCETFDEDGFCTDPKNEDNDPMDGSGHGTHVAGIIGAKGNNITGIAGLIWMGNLMPVKVLNDDGEGTILDVANGVYYAVDNGAKIINASFGGPDYSQTLFNAIATANSNGVLVVAAAGNGGDDGIGDNNDITPEYPANFNLSNIISVAATDQDDIRASFSNFGPTTVDVAAPGVYILSTLPQNLYSDKEFGTGTSMATPHVSGLAGLLTCYYSHLSYLKIKDMVLRYVDVLPTLDGWILTRGRINAHKAMSSLWAPTDLVATAMSPSEISLLWTERATDEDGYRIERRTESGSYSVITTLPAETNTYLNAGLTDGTRYYYRIKAFNDIGDSPSYQTNETSGVTPLSPPTNLTATALSSSEIRLTWQDNSATEDGYKIERKTDPALEFAQIAQVGANEVTFTDSGLEPLSSYFYRVRAFNSVAGDSDYSNEDGAVTLTKSGKKADGGGNGCSIGGNQNAPTAIANMLIMLLPLIFIFILRDRKGN